MRRNERERNVRRGQGTCIPVLLPGRQPVKGKLRITCSVISGVKGTGAENRMRFADGNHFPDKGKQVPVFGKQVPIQPGNFVILAISVVVAKLRIGKLIPGKEHGNAPACQEQRYHVFHLAETEIQHFPVFRGSFPAAVPGVIIAAAVPVAFPVGFIVLFIIGNQVIQREPVMAGDKIIGGNRLPAGIEIGGTADPCGISCFVRDLF